MSLAEVLIPSILRNRSPKLTLSSGQSQFVKVEPKGDTEPNQNSQEDLTALSNTTESDSLLDRFDALGVTTYGPHSSPLSSILGRGENRAPSVLINAADREPLLMSDGQLLQDHLEGLDDVLKIIAASVPESQIALSVPRWLEAKAKSETEVKVVGLPNRYPWNLDEFAARTAFGTQPGSVAAISFECVLSAFFAATEAQSPKDRHLTVIARNGSDSQNVCVPVGTKVREVLDKVEFTVKPGDHVLNGGPMLGVAENVASATVTAQTTAIMLVPESELPPLEYDPCIKCGACADICPMKLQPQKLGRNAELGNFVRNKELGIDDCVHCGLCAFVCPSRRPLLQWMELTQLMLAQNEE